MKILELLFPHFSWAFPRGSHHQLILAAIGKNHHESLEAAHGWLSDNDIDHATFRDQRLLMAVSARFGRELKNHSEYPRLIGLQRMLWTRSMIAMQEAKSSLARIAKSGHEMLLIKGASHVAIRSMASKQRVSADIDIVVKPECMAPVFDMLVEENWTPQGVESHRYLRGRLSTRWNQNFIKGNCGNIDLHSRPFWPGLGGQLEDSRLWEAARQATLSGIPVRVPQPEDLVALAIGHSGLDGHTHSDWLVDCATILRNEKVDWQRLNDILLSRQIAVPAAITFRYFKDKLDFEIPEYILRQLTKSATRHLSKLYFGLIQARPMDRLGPFGQVMRRFAFKQRRKSCFRHMPARPKDRILCVRRLDAIDHCDSGSFVKSYQLKSRSDCKDSPTMLYVEIVLDVQPPSSRRRIELEINSADAHLCRIRFRKWARRKWSQEDGPWRLHFSGTVHNPTVNSKIELVSWSSRLLDHAFESENERYESLAFRVVSCKVS